MRWKIRGTTVKLYVETPADTLPSGEIVYETTPVEVENVLVGEPTTDDIATSTALFSKTLICMLGIPKGDTHDWKDKRVDWTDAYGITHRLKTFGFPITGIEENIPGPWHMKVRCEAYE